MHLYHMDDNTLLIAEEAPDQPDPIKVYLGLTGVVRRWGTTKGRGQLALEGPTENTIVDVEPPGGALNWIHVRRQIPITPGARKKWSQLLSGKK